MSGTRSFSAIGCDALPMISCRWSAGVLLGLFTATAGVIVERRWAGALMRPLELGPLLLTAVLIAAVAAMIRVGRLRGTRVALFSRLDWFVMAWISVAVFFSTAALCMPGTAAAGVVAVGFVAAIEEGCAWTFLLRHLLQPTPIASPPKKCVYYDIPEAVPPDEIVQQITRRRNNDGTEQVFGWIRAAFASGQRTGSVHLAFCPPLGAVPELEVEQTDGPESRIKTSQVLSYGARVDLKLAEPAEQPTTVLLQFLATARK